ncbi:hypothetical protein ACFVRD_47755 [Streptomyces sp. NPDC057908]|uniref:hypothetical protein n=1 Tax=Streptomyces sp. NPDC057908 TaxID=3346276 RepID=UPI0036EEB72E
MTTGSYRFPVPDQRAHHFVSQYANRHELVEDLVGPDGVPEAAATVLRTARELLRQSYYCYEFSTVAVMHSLIAVEIVLRDRIPDAGTKPLHRHIEQGADAGARPGAGSGRIGSGVVSTSPHAGSGTAPTTEGSLCSRGIARSADSRARRHCAARPQLSRLAQGRIIAVTLGMPPRPALGAWADVAFHQAPGRDA